LNGTAAGYYSYFSLRIMSGIMLNDIKINAKNINGE
jgi:hypothetical protein